MAGGPLSASLLRLPQLLVWGKGYPPPSLPFPPGAPPPLAPPTGPARRCPGNRSSRICRRRPAGPSCILAASRAASAAAAAAPAPSPSPSAMPPRRTPAPALLLLLLLGAGPRSGCLGSPVPAAPLPVPGPCSAQPCQNGGVCSQLPAPDPQSPAAAGEPSYSCTCPAGVSGTNCQVSGRGGRGGRGAGHCALSSAGLQGPDPSFSLFGVGDGSGLLARVDADPWPTLQVSLLCLSWFSGRASPGLSGRSVPGPGGYPGPHTSGTTMSRQVARPSRPGRATLR